jgi:hypothetical protein
MAILGQEQNSILSTGGVTQNNLDELFTSKQHNTYSINGVPSFANKPLPSLLDLGGFTPEQYINNLPG